MNQSFKLKPELYYTLRHSFKVFTILTTGGRSVKSKTRNIYREIPDERKEIFISTYKENPILFN